MTAAGIAKALGGHCCVAGTWMARCPAHQDDTASLALKDSASGVLFYCHAGCSQARVMDALRRRGLWGGKQDRREWKGAKEESPARIDAALAIWARTLPAYGTAVEGYLRGRGIDVLPAALRFHGGLKHPAGRVWPAMVGLVTGGLDGAPMGIHRTFLARAPGGWD